MKLRKFQMGGAMPPMEDPAMAGAEAGAVAGAEAGAMEQGAPAEGGEGGDPIMQLVEMAMQALQAQDPQMAMAVCEGLVSIVQGAGGGAPAPGGAPQEPIMARKGNKLVMKNKKGAKARKKC